MGCTMDTDAFILFSGQLSPFVSLSRTKHDIVLVHPNPFEPSILYLCPPYLPIYVISPPFQVNFHVLSLNFQHHLFCVVVYSSWR